MVKRTLALILVLLFAISAAAMAETLPTINVTSKSINEAGNLLTVCAANNKYNKPKGGGKSPQLSWTKVEGAKFYAVCMFDTTANWVHWLVKAIPAKKLTLKQGAYKQGSTYIGPYPPASHGRHSYMIAVLALKQKPDAFTQKVNKLGNMEAIFAKLDTYKKKPGNVINAGYIIGGYAYGDNNK